MILLGQTKQLGHWVTSQIIQFRLSAPDWLGDNCTSCRKKAQIQEGSGRRIQFTE